MSERENSQNTFIAVLENKLDQLIVVVNEIKSEMTTTTNSVSDIKLEMNTLKHRTDQQQKEIDNIYSSNKANKNWIMGIVSGLAVAVIGAILKVVIGL